MFHPEKIFESVCVRICVSQTQKTETVITMDNASTDKLNFHTPYVWLIVNVFIFVQTNSVKVFYIPVIIK